jgi:hypothetical protein
LIVKHLEDRLVAVISKDNSNRHTPEEGPDWQGSTHSEMELPGLGGILGEGTEQQEQGGLGRTAADLGTGTRKHLPDRGYSARMPGGKMYQADRFVGASP